MAIKAVLFDKDGTLIDFNATFGPATARVIAALANGDESRAQDMAAAVDFSLEDRLAAPQSILIAGSVENIARAWQPFCAVADFGPFLLRVDQLFERFSIEALTPFPFTAASISRLRAAGLRLGVATNDSEAAGRAHISKLSLDEQIDFIAGYDSGFGEKPEPGMVLAFAEHLRLSPNEVAMVGDSERDCRAGRSAGAVTIGVLSGHCGLNDLSTHADHVLENIEALPSLINELNGN